MGLFDKKSAPVARTKAAPAPVPVAITGVGIACHAGDKTRSLISSILGQMSGAEMSDTCVVIQNDGSKDKVRVAPVVELAHQQTQQRMITLTAIALWNAAASVSANLPAKSILIVIMVDPKLLKPGNSAGQERLQSYLIDGMRRFETAIFRYLPNTTSGTSALSSAIKELNEGKWQSVIFGGGDSLISMETCLDLHEQNRLNTVSTSKGIVPGEAAAFVVLQTKDTTDTANAALAYLSGVGVAAEPNARDADLKATEGLSAAIEQAIKQAGVGAADIQGLVHNLGAETVHAIEWYQTTKKIWPRRVSEQQRVAAQMGEIEQADMPEDPIPKSLLPYKTMGEVGAAALPMQLATALAWMEYDAHQARWGFPMRNHLLVCDTPAAAERGAVVISRTLVTAT